MMLTEAEELILSGDPLRASELLNVLLEKEPRNAAALHLSGIACIAAQDLSGGVTRLRSAAALSPDPSWLRDLGAACLASGDLKEALRWLEEAVRIDPSHRNGRLVLADALTGCGQPTEALAVLEGLHASDRDACTLRTLGEAYFAAGRAESAFPCFEDACVLDPLSASLHEWCGAVALSLWKFDAAVSHWRQVVALNPGVCQAQCGLALALWCSGEMDECREVSRLARENFPDDERSHINWLRAVDHTTFDPLESRRAWEEWAAFSQSTRTRVQGWGHRSWDPHRVIRVGYLIDEIYKRPNSYFIPPLIENQDLHSFQVFCYLTAPEGSDDRTEIERLVHPLRDMRRQSTAVIAEQVRADSIDILVNVSWEYRNRNIAVFGHRAAPVQIEIPHYPASTGHPEADYVITDKWICPPGEERMYSERVCRLENSYMPWLLPEPAPPLTSSPCSSAGYCTFGLFQKPSKLNRPVWDAIGELMRRVPSSRLIIHNNSSDIERSDSPLRRRFTEELCRRGIAPDRFSFVGMRDYASHFCTIAASDIALDTFPYNGTTTTGDCLWMGVPVVTLKCPTHAGRVGYSMLSRLGLGEFVASTASEYVDFAARLASDPKWLAELRFSLRDRLQSSPVKSATVVVSGIEQEFRNIWQRLCEQENTRDSFRR